PPGRARAEALTILAKLGHERVLYPKRSGEMAHERGEELISSLGFDTLDNGTEGSAFRKRRLFLHLIPLVWLLLPILPYHPGIARVWQGTKAAKREPPTDKDERR